jgi:hypothetical protein
MPELSQIPYLRASYGPNISFQGTKTRALRGFCPLNSSR